MLIFTIGPTSIQAQKSSFRKKGDLQIYTMLEEQYSVRKSIFEFDVQKCHFRHNIILAA